MNEVIYILINEAMLGYVKIGKTTNLEQRIRSLDTTGVPLPFECFYACKVKDATFVENQLFDAFRDHRVRSSREFFEVAPARVVAALKLAEVENVTPKNDFVESQEDQKALDEARVRRDRFNFEMVNIPVDSEIYFTGDENKKAKVVDLHAKKSIEFNGELTSLSASAQKILEVGYGVAGTDYWMYEGETLDERRRRMEKGDDDKINPDK